MFHSHDDWFWERLPDGSVRVTKQERCAEFGKGKPIAEHVLTPESWASIVASVSAAGEESDRYYKALAFHNQPKP